MKLSTATGALEAYSVPPTPPQHAKIAVTCPAASAPCPALVPYRRRRSRLNPRARGSFHPPGVHGHTIVACPYRATSSQLTLRADLINQVSISIAADIVHCERAAVRDARPPTLAGDEHLRRPPRYDPAHLPSFGADHGHLALAQQVQRQRGRGGIRSPSAAAGRGGRTWTAMDFVPCPERLDAMTSSLFRKHPQICLTRPPRLAPRRRRTRWSCTAITEPHAAYPVLALHAASDQTRAVRRNDDAERIADAFGLNCPAKD